MPPEPPRLKAPGDAMLVIWTLPKRLPVAGVLVAGGAVPAELTDAEASPAFPSAREVPKANPAAPVDVLAGCAPPALGGAALVLALALSST